MKNDKRIEDKRIENILYVQKLSNELFVLQDKINTDFNKRLKVLFWLFTVYFLGLYLLMIMVFIEILILIR